MGFELFVARRYLLARRKQAFIAVITMISIAGITVGVTALVIALALLTGFNDEIRGKILAANAHVLVYDALGAGIADYSTAVEKIREATHVVSATPVGYGTVLMASATRTSGVFLKGIDLSDDRVASELGRQIIQGSLAALKLASAGPRPGVLLGKELASTLGTTPGDAIEVYVPRGHTTPFGSLPAVRRFTVSGIYSTGIYDYDSNSAVITLDVAQRLFDIEGRCTYIEVRVDDIYAAAEVGDRLRDAVGHNFYVMTWMELNRPLFSALKIEKTVLFSTISLIVLVASFNIISTIILMVMEKNRDIAILMSMGARRRSILKVFLYHGVTIGCAGILMGVLLGLVTCHLFNEYQVIKIPVDIYQIPYVPFKVRAIDVLAIAGVAFLITLAATIFPSRRAARLDPSEAIRYE
ncbi:MAG: FtsX-like permease family protein [Acidobacteriota bacterium]